MAAPSLHYQVLLHSSGPALWPEHKPLEEVLALEAKTPESIWSSTYQGVPRPPKGFIFKREWFTRYPIADAAIRNSISARYISWDAGLKDKEENSYTAYVVGELTPDYRLLITAADRDRWTFPDLPGEMERVSARYNRDRKLTEVLIEDKASGITALQTLTKISPDDPYQGILPTVDKVTRANQAAVWCKNGCVLLPFPEDVSQLSWLWDFEDEIFNFPSVEFNDWTDALTQLIIYLENLLAFGWEMRRQRNGTNDNTVPSRSSS